MKKRTWSRALVASVAVLGVLVSGLVSAPTTAEAASASSFDPGELISDENFYAGGSMDAGAVQRFLDERRPQCVSGYTCLVDYKQATPTMPANRYCTAMNGASNESSASIIARVGAACGINPRVLLVLLEKEQSLVTHRSPNATRYAKATGFGCPDTAPCDSSFGGFFYQVYYAARQFQVYKTFPQNYNHIAGRVNNVLYHPNAACGSSPVLIRNQATAGLYNYTPYQPNAAALANLYGTGDACSAYGNRNFWRIWTDWFGDPRSSNGIDPFGSIQSVSTTPARAIVQGFAIDPSAPAQAISVNLYIDGVWQRTYRADQPNAAAGQALAGAGNNHGFTMEFGMRGAAVEACIAALNVGAGQDQWIGCRTVQPPSGPPVGRIDGASAAGLTAQVSGWALDPDTTAPITVHAYVNGAYAGPFIANKPRPDVGRVYRDYGDNHGFAFQVPIPIGTSEVCVYAIAVPLAANPLLGCSSVSNASGPPRGQLEGTSTAPGSVTATGWALDPDTVDPISVQLLVDGAVAATVRADTSRPDVGRSFPGYGDRHGYSISANVTGGSHTVCVRAVNVGQGQNVQLGCRSVEGVAGPPRGQVESASAAPGSVSASGWALDPDTASAIDVQLLVDGTVAATGRADLSRPDVGRSFPGYGDRHGYSLTAQVGGGSHSVCVRAINVGAGQNAQLGCRTVQTPTGPPVGRIEAASASGRTASVSGWALDPDTTAPITVHAYVNGGYAGPFIANTSRPDVARVYPGYGDRHGFALQVPIPVGTSEVCVYAIAVPMAANPQLGCSTVSNASGPPRGQFEGLSSAPGSMSASGWALDPDTAGPIDVQLLVDGAVVATGRADLPRADIARAFPGYGDRHGFAVSANVSAGSHLVCVRAVNVGAGQTTDLGCRRS